VFKLSSLRRITFALGGSAKKKKALVLKRITSAVRLRNDTSCWTLVADQQSQIRSKAERKHSCAVLKDDEVLELLGGMLDEVEI